MKLNLNLKTLEDWTSLLTLILVVLNIVLLVIGGLVVIARPYSSELLERWGISVNVALWILMADFILVIIWFILFKIYKRSKKKF